MGRISALLAIFAVAGCEPDPHALAWEIAFNPESLRARAETVRARVIEGGCDPSAGAVYDETIAIGARAPAPRVLDRGRYGLSVRVRDASCVAFAEGCRVVDLPAGEDRVEVLVIPLETEVLERCTDAGLADAGTDAGERDGGSPADAGPGDCDVEACSLGCSPMDPTQCARVQSANVPWSTWDTTAGDLVFTTSATIDTGTCDALAVPGVVVTLGAAGEACVLSARALRIAAGATVRVIGSRSLIVLASDMATIDGVLDLSAQGPTPGAGGGAGATNTTPAGGRNVGANGVEGGASGDSGGGGGGHCGRGGDGGGDASRVARGGAAEPETWELEPLAGGSGGGTGANDSAAEASGGGGGGALQITSQVGIRIAGVIRAGGGGGRGGTSVGAGNGAGAGGGSGGAVLLEAPLIDLGAIGVVLASGGGGGAGTDGGGTGAPGQDGASAAGRAMGGSGSGGRGGDSGGGATPDGLAGGLGSFNAGGGGGGSGCVLLRNADGSLPADVLARQSPSVAPALRVQRVRVE